MSDKWKTLLEEGEGVVREKRRHDKREEKELSDGGERRLTESYWRSTVDWGGGAGFIVERLPGGPCTGRGQGARGAEDGPGGAGKVRPRREVAAGPVEGRGQGTGGSL